MRADLASEARRKAERETEDDRKIDLAAVPATDAIFVIGKFLGFVQRSQHHQVNLQHCTMQHLFLPTQKSK